MFSHWLWSWKFQLDCLSPPLSIDVTHVHCYASLLHGCCKCELKPQHKTLPTESSHCPHAYLLKSERFFWLAPEVIVKETPDMRVQHSWCVWRWRRLHVKNLGSACRNRQSALLKIQHRTHSYASKILPLSSQILQTTWVSLKWILHYTAQPVPFISFETYKIPDKEGNRFTPISYPTTVR